MKPLAKEKRFAGPEPPGGARPWVLVNMAMTADGKIASANRLMESFGSARDLQHLYELRATTDAILCGAGTVAGAGITLGTGGRRYELRRRQHDLAPDALRVVVSGRGRLSPEAEVFRSPGGRVLVLAAQGLAARRRLAWERAGAVVWVGGVHRVDLDGALRWLGAAWGVRRLVCEGGAELNAGMLAAGLVDEIHVTVCPRVFGGREAPTLADGAGVAGLDAATGLRCVGARRVGGEMFLRYRVERREG